MKKRIGVIGCGNMGSAIVKAVASRQKAGSAYSGSRWSLVVCYDSDRKKTAILTKRFRTKTASSSSDLAKRCDVIILAVKPKDIAGVIHEIKDHLAPSKLLITIAAGIRTETIEKAAGFNVPVVRVMPNMPSLIGAGIAAVCKGRYAKSKAMDTAKRIFENIGQVVEIEEKFMDAVTAISGSGPAYFFYLAEMMIRQAVSFGIGEKAAERIVVETALGSARLLKETKGDPGALRAMVTAKGGTTEAAFMELCAHDFEGIFKKALNKALVRARELSRGGS